MNKNKLRKRPSAQLIILPKIVIIPQGQTEANYFKNFQSQTQNKARVAVKNPQSNLIKLKKKAIKELKNIERTRPDDQIKDISSLYSKRHKYCQDRDI